MYLTLISNSLLLYVAINSCSVLVLCYYMPCDNNRFCLQTYEDASQKILCIYI